MDSFRGNFKKGGRHTLRSAFLGAGRLKLLNEKLREGNSCPGLLTSLAKELRFVPSLLIYCQHGVDHG